MAVDVGQPDVEQHQRRLRAVRGLQGFAAGRAFAEQLVPLGLEQRAPRAGIRHGRRR
jgi:hypothetical protein